MPELCGRQPDSPFSVIILAGGQGRRLGEDKALLRIDGETLLDHMLGALAALSDNLIVVVRRQQAICTNLARVVSDLAPYTGVLAGIAAGLLAAHYEWSLLVACDMPFVSLELVSYMNSQRHGHDAVVPQRHVGLEPLHALYHRRCLPALRQTLEAGHRRVVSFYRTLDVRYLTEAEISRFDPDGRSFFNINTREDLARARIWHQQLQSSEKEPRRSSR
jgi:molybdopterin-guanine dinucleotide biosynthesis protein A